MTFNLDLFKKNLKSLTKETFVKCTKKIDIKNICGFALYSDNSAMTISVSLNTNIHLKENQNKEKGYDIYFKWTPGEWKYEMINSKEYEFLNKMLQDSHNEIEDSYFLKHRNEVYNCGVEILEELKKEGVFRRANEDFVVMFAISDFSEPELEIEFVKRLNSNPKTKEFKEWIESEEN